MKITKELRFEDVRRVCIEYNLYTNGTNKDYENLMYMCQLKNITDYRLMLISKDILKHSVTDLSLGSIMTMLNEQIFIWVEE